MAAGKARAQRGVGGAYWIGGVMWWRWSDGELREFLLAVMTELSVVK